MICTTAVGENHRCYLETRSLTEKFALYKISNGNQSFVNSSSRCHEANKIYLEGKSNFSLLNSGENLEPQALNSRIQQTVKLGVISSAGYSL